MIVSFLHLLAYGNSDQASFRNDQVRSSFDVMSVPGTIAAYYSEATAAFALANQKDYLIDPRTPLFQGEIDEPRASHFSLATWHGSAVREFIDTGADVIGPEFYRGAVLSQMVEEVTSRQRDYAQSADVVESKLDRYAALLEEALTGQGAELPRRERRPPRNILLPYFAVDSTSGAWADVQKSVWLEAQSHEESASYSRVICVDGRRLTGSTGPDLLDDMLDQLSTGFSADVFFWITDFDERKVPVSELRRFLEVVQAHPHLNKVNLYGGYFSIIAMHAGLAGFGNGLTYSESRSWPTLSSTGAAPPRYYVPRLHAFLPVGPAASLELAAPEFRCACDACEAWRATGSSIASLPYHELKRHFALARASEVEYVSSSDLPEISVQLRSAFAEFQRARSHPALGSLPGMAHLDTWADAISP